jgi:hypothetical protein
MKHFLVDCSSEDCYSYYQGFSFVSGVIAACIVILCCGCTRQEEAIRGTQGQLLEKLSFSVDTSKLGALIIDSVHRVAFRVPKQWEPLADSLKKRAQQQAQTVSSDGITIHPLQLFVHATTSSALVVSRVEFPAQDSTTQQCFQHYAALVMSNKSVQTKQGEFLKDSLPVMQFVVQSERQVAYKLLCADKRGVVLQFDFILFPQHVVKEVRSVESVIGSMYRF